MNTSGSPSPSLGFIDAKEFARVGGTKVAQICVLVSPGTSVFRGGLL